MEIIKWEKHFERMDLNKLRKTIDALDVIKDNDPIIFDEFEGLSGIRLIAIRALTVING